MRVFGTIFMGVVLFFGLIFGLNLVGLGMTSFFAPKYRAIDNAVFKESEQYNDGMIRDLENLQMEYIKADEAQRAVLKSITLHRFSVYDQNRLPPNLWNFYNDLRSGKL